MTMEIRSATKADMPGLLQLVDQIQRQHAVPFPEEFHADPDTTGLQAFFGRLMEEDQQILLVAHEGAERVGYLWCEIQRFGDTLFRPARTQLYIQHVCVDAGHRRQGIASALFARIDALAQSEKIGRIGLDTWAGNDTALSFFHAHGYETRQIKLLKTIG
jgi:ribosomal protein S18 acetylase RimI-like enzyme